MNNVYLLLGSNLFDSKKALYIATQHLAAKVGSIKQHSSLYQTAAWGKRDQPDFLNQVVIIKTLLPPDEVLEKILEIEKVMGRIRSEKNAPRLIDIDILFYNDRVISEARLSVPHPAISLRRFVLVPLNELSPKMLHPVLNKTIGELLLCCPDTLDVKRI